MQRSQFTFYESFFKAISRIKKKQDRADAYDMICSYALFQIEPDLESASDAVAIAFELLRPVLDKAKERAENGKKGGSKQEANRKQTGSKQKANGKQEKTVSKKEKEKEIEIEIEIEKDNISPTEIEGADKPPKPARQKFGTYGWVKLTDAEYSRLVAEYGQAEALRCIGYVDEAAQSTGNKNKWSDWNLVVRKCHRDGWGRQKSNAPGGYTSGIDRLAAMYREEFGDD